MELILDLLLDFVSFVFPHFFVSGIKLLQVIVVYTTHVPVFFCHNAHNSRDTELKFCIFSHQISNLWFENNAEESLSFKPQL